MKMRHVGSVALVGLSVCALAIGRGQPAPSTSPSNAPAPAAAPSAASAAENRAVVAVGKSDAWWKQRRDAITANAKKGDVALVFMGDSITQGWEGAGKDVWAKTYGPRKSLNCGIGGDQTQHLLYRIQNGNVEGLDKPIREGAATPKLVVMMIGTNNSNKDDFTPAQIAEGVKACLDATRAKLPDAHVLLLGIFPRGEHNNPQRDKLAATNAILKTYADETHITYLDIGDKFLQPDGSISKEIMPDFLHLSPKGYQIWADAIEPQVKKYLGEK